MINGNTVYILSALILCLVTSDRATSQEFTAPTKRGWACLFDYSDRSSAIERGQALTSSHGYKGYRYSKIRIFKRSNGRYVVCTGQVRRKKYVRKSNFPGRFRYETGADFISIAWSSLGAQDEDSGREATRVNSQLRTVLKGVHAAKKFCEDNPDKCASNPATGGRDKSQDIMGEIICRDRGIC